LRRGSGRGRYGRRWADDAGAHVDGIRVQRHSPIESDEGPDNIRTGCSGDGSEGQYPATECGEGTKGGGRPDLPEDIACLSAVRQRHTRERGRGERGTNLEHEPRVGVSEGIQGEEPRELSGTAEAVDTGKQNLLAKVLPGEVECCLLPSSSVVGRCCVSMCLNCNAIVDMKALAGGEAGDRRARADANISCDGRGPGVSNSRPSQHTEARRRSKIDGLRPNKQRQRKPAPNSVDANEHHHLRGREDSTTVTAQRNAE
jgi:hypothetical protein